MTREQEAATKFEKVLKPNISRAAKDLFIAVISGEKTVSRKDTYFSKDAAEIIAFVEDRLAAPHLNYLEKSQNNGIWGDSTTQALKDMGEAYNFVYSDKIDQPMALALVDGTIANPKTMATTDPTSYNWLKRECINNNGKQAWTNLPGHVNLIGIRGYILDKGKVDNVDNIYNDIISVAYIDARTKAKVVKSFVASCDPGRYYYKIRPLNRRGCAHLQTGFWKYQLGRHGRYQYRALVQAAAVTVSRSYQGTYEDADYAESGWFGINIHAGTRAKYVENASAGCQVIWSSSYRGWEYKQFMKLMDMGAANGQRVIGYNLMDSRHIK